jgi:hypothetical protein
MKSEAMTMEEIRTEGLEALAERLGTVGMIRFLQQFHSGDGNYTSERKKLFDGLTLQEILDEARPEDK